MLRRIHKKSFIENNTQQICYAVKTYFCAISFHENTPLLR